MSRRRGQRATTTGQLTLDFERPLAPPIRRLRLVSSTPASELVRPATVRVSIDEAFELAVSLEERDLVQAEAAYRALLVQAPAHADAHVNLGRLLQVGKRAAEAEQHYRLALKLRPDDVTAAFNLATALEDQRRWEEAIQAYAQAIALDPHLADAHYNLACLYERIGQKTAAIRHLKSAKAALPPRR